jgi:hypothetical protein
METKHVYDNYEISGCHRIDDAGLPDREGASIETCDDGEAWFWTLYGHIDGEGVEAIGDFSSREAAEQVFLRITGQPFTASYQASPRLRLMHAAPKLLAALQMASNYMADDLDESDETEMLVFATGRAAIAEAKHGPLPIARVPLEITEDEFDERFPLVTNHLNPNASWGSGKEDGCLFETYDEELEFVRRQDPRTVWTLVDGDGDDQYLVSGFHVVNRVGYLISTVPLPEGLDIEVRIPNENADNPETDKAGEA